MVYVEHVFKIKPELVGVRYYNSETKESWIEKEEVKPELFIPKSVSPDSPDSGFISQITLEPLVKIPVDTIESFKNVATMYENANVTVYGTTDSSLNWIINHSKNWVEENNHEMPILWLDIEVTGAIDDNFPPALAWKPNNAMTGVSLIQMYDTKSSKYYVLGLKDFNKKIELKHGEVVFKKCNSESDLLLTFLNILEVINPTVVMGYNSEGYDFPYLTHRIARVLDGYKGDFVKNNAVVREAYRGKFVKRLSPVGICSTIESKAATGKLIVEMDWRGIILADYMKVYQQNMTLNDTLSSYSLNSVASFELGKEKVNYDEYTNLTDLENQNYDLFVEYGVRDVELLIDLEEKLKLWQLIVFSGYLTLSSPTDMRRTYMPWYRFFYSTVYHEGKVLPYKPIYANEPDDRFIGGYLYYSAKFWRSVVSFDFKSLYPSLIRAANIGVETFIPEDKLPEEVKNLKDKYFIKFEGSDDTKTTKKRVEKFVREVILNKEVSEKVKNVLQRYDIVGTPAGNFFKRDRVSTLAGLVDKVLSGRTDAKKKMFDAERRMEECLKNKDKKGYELAKADKDKWNLYQFTYKILANRVYGTLSMDINVYAGSKKIANSITSSGQSLDMSLGYVISDIVSKYSRDDYKEGEYFNNDNVSQQDTDSTRGDTLINVDDREIPIEDFFNEVYKSPENSIEVRDKDNEIVLIKNKDYLTPSLNKSGSLELKRITYAFRHKVKKRFFKVTFKDKEVIITEDHSIIILRDKGYLSIKPTDIKKGDKIISIRKLND